MKKKNNKNRVDLSRCYPCTYLTQREADCAYLLPKYGSYKRIGEILGISIASVTFHLGNVKSKLHCINNATLLRFMEAIDFNNIYEEIFKNEINFRG